MVQASDTPAPKPKATVAASDFVESMTVGQAARVAHEVGVSREQFERLSGTSLSRLRRGRAGNEPVDAKALGSLRRCAAVYSRALALCGGDAEAAKRWLNGDAPALKGKKPIVAAETAPGLKAVEELLTVLEKSVGR
jgi:putative toxin-antitoxin system antitoxin component (TIGR02293 family)